jgi:hypothetical protein
MVEHIIALGTGTRKNESHNDAGGLKTVKRHQGLVFPSGSGFGEILSRSHQGAQAPKEA